MVENGGEIVLTDRGRPVGKIVPVERDVLSLASRVKTMEDTGMVEPVLRKGARSLPPPIPVAEGLAQKILAEDRKDAHAD
jgi:antitoxin (DNA-binding transcriptional repressor) of toxin-antitoxin stability system